MPAFTFEKISPPARRAPAAALPKKPRGLISQVIDRFAERRARRALQSEPETRRDEKPAE
jgi:choline dehydrogenase-like flavoprotein